MNCNIMKDLIPSYIDGICSEETTELVEDHIRHCKTCHDYLNMMQQQPVYVQEIPEKVEKAIKPFKKINRKRYIQVFAAIAITFMITTIGALVVQEVSAVNQIFFPKESAVISMEGNREEWEPLRFNDQNYLMFDSIFWDKKITNYANDAGDVLLRVKDSSGNVVMDEVQVPNGKSVKLEELKRNEPYYFEIKSPPGHFLINAT
ncbi:MAG: zf-HC2 domain-containing protein [Lysinibacillus sp.]